MTRATHCLTEQQLLTDLLKRVSRSFYLTLRVLPHSLRSQIGLAYLFARAADTIADTNVLEKESRLYRLRQFKTQFEEGQIAWTQLKEIQDAVVPRHQHSAERVLLEHLEDCFRVFLAFSPDDRTRIRDLMNNLIPGMEMDLTLFPEDSPNEVTALHSLDDLDRYIYHVAGCVGEFWTKMSCAHQPALAGWHVDHMAKMGVRFGKGLQLTNVLKDVARDLQRGRCYLPELLLREVNVKPADLLRKESLTAVRPVINHLAKIALEHLDQGWLYTLAIPRRELRLRLACMWPLLFAGETLRLVSVSRDLLDPDVNVKMARGHVYRLMALTTITGACGVLWTAHWGRLRKSVV